MNEKGIFDPEAAIQAVRDELQVAARTDIFTCFDLGINIYCLMKKIQLFK